VLLKLYLKDSPTNHNVRYYLVTNETAGIFTHKGGLCLFIDNG